MALAYLPHLSLPLNRWDGLTSIDLYLKRYQRVTAESTA